MNEPQIFSFFFFDLLFSEQFIYNDDGCACIFTLCKNENGKVTLINGNIGDSRTIFAKKEAEGYKAIACTYDHKPTDAKEKERIEAAKGYVSVCLVFCSS